MAESFTYVATDANGNTATGTITVNIVDDVPTAVADINSGIEGAHCHRQRADRRHRRRVRGGRCGDDGAGRRGDRGCGGQRHLFAGVWPGSGLPVTGSFGVLTLNANGSYSYDGNPNVVPPAGATDVFVYTITDGDGDTSTTTLTINLTDSGIIAPADSDVTVNENALDTTALPDGPDLAAGTVTGSLPGSAAETDATNQLNATSSVPM